MADNDDFRDFVIAQSRDLLRFAWMLTGDGAKAEDLLQASLAKTWPHWARISESGSPDRYLRKVMTNTAIAWGRRRWRFEVPTSVLPEIRARDETALTDDRELLRWALAQLPRRQRAVVVLRYYDGYSELEAAEILNCSVGTIKSQSSRALEKLRAMLPQGAMKEPV